MSEDDYEQYIGQYRCAEEVDEAKNSTQRWSNPHLALLLDVVEKIKPVGGPNAANSMWHQVAAGFNEQRRETWKERDASACYRKSMQFPKAKANVRVLRTGRRQCAALIFYAIKEPNVRLWVAALLSWCAQNPPQAILAHLEVLPQAAAGDTHVRF